MTALKPDTSYDTIYGSPATAAYLADLMYQHPIIQVRMSSKPGYRSWAVTFALTAQMIQVEGTMEPKPVSSVIQFDFGIINISKAHRYYLNDSAVLPETKEVSEQDRKAWSEFLTLLAKALGKLHGEGRSAHIVAAPAATSVTTPDQTGRLKLRLRAAE